MDHHIVDSFYPKTPRNRLEILRAIMFWVFVLQLMTSFEGSSGAEHETLCSSNACFTLHMDLANFETASQSCIHNGGYLMSIREREEDDVLQLLLSQIKRQHQDRSIKFWIGLKLYRGNCSSADETLRGFKWVSGEKDSHYSNWIKEPVTTCTEERCVRAHYTSLGQTQLKWIDGSCKSSAFYVCKFYFRGMCKPLALLGPGQINYTAPFSDKPQKSVMQLFPLGTYAQIECSDQSFHYSVCMEKDNIYDWTAHGPYCKAAKRYCTVNNGGCEHLCSQDVDEARCICKEGYNLDEDGLTCRMKDLCSVDTCEHQCVTRESGYSCECPDGFKLDVNQHNCSDIDECQSQICEHHLCINTHGSYSCVCKDGYKMDMGKCSDIDECVQPICEHICLNRIGSFSCKCNEGFTLSEDGYSCVDINECVSHVCHQQCVNTEGSFFCTCQQGFHMDTNGSICAPDVTETSAASSDDRVKEGTRENITDFLTRDTDELQHQPPHAYTTLPTLVNVTDGDQQSNNTALVTSFAKTGYSRVIICVLGSLVPLLLLVAVTIAIALFRCRDSQKEVKKNTTTDGYCWVSSGLDPRLEKLYESILTDDL
ncbi:complement component C1q receptor [Notolabrus celidotus]|uniref:complement component C1q receptor n=1 Tax=Notolabrus celidotus TaxID=1203425 RepID=UPI00148F92A8|nr:complement component C1q receptor [Notolabrus celidotus]